MSDIDEVLERIEGDFDFNLAVRADPREALRSYDLDEEELAAFETSGRALWSLVLRRTAREDVERPDGGLPPPPPPFTVNHSHVDWRADALSLQADEQITATISQIRAAQGVSREQAVLELMERIG